jgi:hypothetical protein
MVLFNQSIICRKVLFSMYYVIFRWATGGIKFWESASSSINFIPFFIFSNSDHVGWRSGLSDTISEGDHPRTIPPPLMTPFQNCVRQSRHPSSMATVAKHRKGGWNFNFFPLKLLGRKVMSKVHIILWVRWAKKKGGAYYFLSMVKSQKIDEI